MEKKDQWDTVILPKINPFDLNLREIWEYRDLLLLLIRRDFVAMYKQTILGPIWFFLQPLLMTLVFTFVFGNIAQISTDGLPKVLFYLSGITVWNYFSNCLTEISNVFRTQVHLYSKVYFPRLILPLSIIFSNLVKLGIQFLLLIIVTLYFYTKGIDISLTANILLIPFIVLLMAILSLGLGLIISSMTAKYRDLVHLVAFGLRLLMYISPVILPLSALPQKYAIFIMANPMTAIIETFRYSLLGTGTFTIEQLMYSICFSLVAFIVGLLYFNQTQQSFVDTV